MSAHSSGGLVSAPVCVRDISNPVDIIPRYFIFASESLKNGIDEAFVRQKAEQYNKNVILGVDLHDDQFDLLVNLAKSLELKLHFYLEGPGGTTGSSGWYKDEKERIDVAARNQGIQIKWKKSGSRWWPAKNDKGYLQWRDFGWKEHTKSEIEKLSLEGAYSVEIDNLYNDINGDTVENTIHLVSTFESWNKSLDRKVKIVLKNLNGPTLEALAGAVESGLIQRSTLADFHLAEFETGERIEQLESSKKMAIQTIFTGDDATATDNYRIPTSPEDRGIYSVCPHLL